MITQKQEEELQQKAQAASPVEGKPTATPIAPSTRPVLAPPRRWRQVLLVILAIALPLVAGSMISWPWPGAPDFLDSELSFYSVVIATIVSTFVGAFLLYFVFRAWWAALLAPAAWIVGEFLSAVVRPLVEGGWPALQAQEHFWDAQGVIIQLALLPLIICAGFGAVGVFALDALVRRRAARR